MNDRKTQDNATTNDRSGELERGNIERLETKNDQQRDEGNSQYVKHKGPGGMEQSVAARKDGIEGEDRLGINRGD